MHSTFRSLGSVWLTAALLAVAGPLAAVDVLTQHNDTSRTGANLSETILTPSNVNQSTFGKLFSYTVNGQVYAQPLYVSQYNFGGSIGTRNAVIIATENNYVYAFDADNLPATGGSPQIWSLNLGTSATQGNGSCSDLFPTVGITGTPVIDKAAGIIYLVSKTNTAGTYADTLHALNLASGAETANSPQTVSGSFGGATFNPQYQFNRPGLLLANGRVYIGFGSHCDGGTYQGWLFGYTTSNLSSAPVIYCTSPVGNQGAIWQSGKGLVADAGGNLYCATGNGAFVGTGTAGDKGMALLKLSATLGVLDFFINANAASESGFDEDFGSGGPLLVPGTTRLVMAGKPGDVYVCDTGALGGFQQGAGGSDNCAQKIANALSNGADGNAQCPVYWNGPNGPTVYYFCGRHDANASAGFARAFHFNTGTNLLDTAPTSTSTVYQNGRAGGSSLSANGATNGILWGIKSDYQGNGLPGSGRLVALDASNLATLLWDSEQNAARDSFGNYTKLSYPTIANGRVYVPTSQASDTTNFTNVVISAYGLLAPWQNLPTTLAFGTQPSSTTTGTAISPAVTVRILDANGALVTTANYAVTISLGANPGGATLSGTLTVSAVNGIATFNNLLLNNAGSGYTLVATSIPAGGALVGLDIGGPGQAGSTTRVAGGYNVVGGGADIYNTSDQFHYGYTTVSGDFDFRARVNSVTNTDLYTKTGLMARASTAVGSRNAMNIVFPTNAARNMNTGGYEYQFRDVDGGGTTANHPDVFTPPNVAIPVAYPAGWLRLQKVGNVFSSFYSADGTAWSQYTSSTSTTAYPATYDLGLAVCAHNNSLSATAQFRNLSLNGVPYLDSATSSAFNVVSGSVVQTPVITPAGGTFSGPVTVTITDATAGSAIHYTLDGSTPTGASTTYAGTFQLSANTTVKAIGTKATLSDSAVATASFTITGTTPYGMDTRPPITPLSVPTNLSTNPPALLSGTGVFSNLTTMTPNPGIVPYSVNTPLWSDGADKNRWIALPPGGKIAFQANGEWIFPNGTVLIKSFALGATRLETRLLVITSTGPDFGYGITYKWRADNSDAELMGPGTANGWSDGYDQVVGAQTWHYPSRSECLTCHLSNAGFVLGPKTRQLNGNFTYPSSGRTDNQLRTWNYLQMFTAFVAGADALANSYTRSKAISDGSATLEDRVKSYLDANCGQCHRPGGVSTNWDARYDTPMTSEGIINVDPTKGNFGIAGAKIVKPQDVPLSIMHYRMNSTSTTPLVKMPPLARNLVDATAVGVLDQWIGSLPPSAGGSGGGAPGSQSIYKHRDCGYGSGFTVLALLLFFALRRRLR